MTTHRIIFCLLFCFIYSFTICFFPNISFNFLINNATKVIAISEYTRKDLETFFNVPRPKIHVIYCSVNAPKQTFWNRPSPIPEKYLLYVNIHNRELTNATIRKLMFELNKEDPHGELYSAFYTAKNIYRNMRNYYSNIGELYLNEPKEDDS